ncbi:UNVERIFIED_CONTAM: hypothetical protein Sradi_6915000 [Sesamum radiatum]|uniref:Zinc finger C3HC4 RING-type domain-containing protein n=1 Tax=Sesamum radiatum TaxID=300843 RepID=A0AAW2JHQ4_SESRA
MALVKGCEHAYCVKCILRVGFILRKTNLPKCKAPFEFLIVHRTLDGRVYDYLFEESVFLLLRVSWFKPRVVVEREEVDEDFDDLYDEDEVEDLAEAYLRSSKGLRIGNRRWRDDGYVRVGEARPVGRLHLQDSSAGPSRQHKKKEPAVREAVSQREKRNLKREAAAAAKHQRHLARLGRS